MTEFLEQNASWLSKELLLPTQTKTGRKHPGRPRKSFEELLQKSKKRKVASLTEQFSVYELTAATSSKLYKAGERSAATHIQKTILNPNMQEVRKSYTEKKETPVPYTSDEAVIFLLDNNLSQRQYKNIRHSAKKTKCPHLT